jgi:peptidoglycan/LPS O-acetylase OafA/YrhL
MGVAMLWVIAFHYGGFHFPVPIIKQLVGIGYGGVDMFLFLSGMGLYFSLSKDHDIYNFYKRRFLRIMPYYVPIVLIFLIVHQKTSFLTLFYGITTIGFWVGNYAFDWYVPSLLILYLITPFYWLVFKKEPIIATIIIVLVAIIISFLLMNTELSRLLIFTTRIPIYFIGLYVGYCLRKPSCNSTMINALMIIIMFLGMIWLFINLSTYTATELLANGLWWYPFILITLPLLLMLSYLMNFFKSYNYSCLKFIGQYSLVIYLLHQWILAILKSFFTDNYYSTEMVAIVITFFAAFLYQNVIKLSINILEKNRNL